MNSQIVHPWRLVYQKVENIFLGVKITPDFINHRLFFIGLILVSLIPQSIIYECFPEEVLVTKNQTASNHSTSDKRCIVA